MRPVGLLLRPVPVRPLPRLAPAVRLNRADQWRPAVPVGRKVPHTLVVLLDLLDLSVPEVPLLREVPLLLSDRAVLEE